jgi:hypothetical protein
MAYASKLDDFESFVAHAKLATLALVPAATATGGRGDAGPQRQQVCPVSCELERHLCCWLAYASA